MTNHVYTTLTPTGTTNVNRTFRPESETIWNIGKYMRNRVYLDLYDWA